MPALNISHGVSAVCFAFSVQNESIFEPFCDNEQQSQEILHAMRKHWIVAFSQPTTEKKIRPELPDPLNCSFENRYNRKFPLENPYKIHLVAIHSHASQPTKLKKFSCKKIFGMRSIGISRSSAFDKSTNFFLFKVIIFVILFQDWSLSFLTWNKLFWIFSTLITLIYIYLFYFFVAESENFCFYKPFSE